MTTKQQEEKIQEIAKLVESEYKMGGLSNGLYCDFAKEVALRFLHSEQIALLKEIEKDYIEWVMASGLREYKGKTPFWEWKQRAEAKSLQSYD